MNRQTLRAHLLGLVAMITFSVAQPTLAATTSSPLFPALSFVAGLLNQPVFPSSDAYTIRKDLRITAADGVQLAGNVFIPNGNGGPYPAVIFINSWGLNQYEYLTEAAQFASQGYVVLSYTTRGFGQSGGLIDTAGPKDISDLSTAIDWLIANTPTDPDRIGAAGISYGSGISLIGAAKDPRIHAVAALSSWGSLKQSLYGEQTPRMVWGDLLVVASQLLGHPDPIIAQYYAQLLSNDDTPDIDSWAAERSPISYVNRLNANGTAVYLSKNWGDNLFQPNSILDMYRQLTGPKHIDLQPGTHASTEIFGMLGGGDTHIWNDVHRWFDSHLKGMTTAIDTAPPVQMKVPFTNNGYEGFSAFPVPQAHTDQWYLHPRGLFHPGYLKDTPWQDWFPVTNSIHAGMDTVASTGIPLGSQIFEEVNLPTVASMPLIDPSHGIWFETNTLSDGLKIRGTPSVTLQVTPQSTKAQLVAYLYDMNALGIGTLITHAPVTLLNQQPGKATTVTLPLVTTAYNLPAGDHLVLAIDTQDLLYKQPTSDAYKVDFPFTNSRQSVLKVPVL
ncbi:alpha/beta fold hydrolase [Mangrovitalea sediminis]|uniref:alpha/beta fold hydrolase n=1 Tax=Mangrovitalea sediminis TaxID=1982043 RepID=UPI0018EA21B9|nr:alpha/beta fold hydrolase [Mangrovitalea sediminis]